MEPSGPVQGCNGRALPSPLLFKKKKPFSLGQDWRMSQKARAKRAQLTYFLRKYFVTRYVFTVSSC